MGFNSGFKGLISKKNNAYFILRPIYIFDHHFSQFLFRMRNVSDERCRENQNNLFMFNNLFFFFENRTIYEITWKCMVQLDRSRMTVGRMRIACWIIKVTNTHSAYVILIAFRHQQWLQKRLYMTLYVQCLSCSVLPSKLLVFLRTRSSLCSTEPSSLSAPYKLHYKNHLQFRSVMRTLFLKSPQS